MTAAVVTAPMKAATGKRTAGWPVTIQKTASRLAPVSIPMMSGETSGFRTTPWKSAPATASPAPMRMAQMMRGNRRVRTTKTWSSEPMPRTAARASLKGIR